jgi:nitroimidazol reductase NimA-like FMN-containing flavoprotein (pyridoxamine 5'-phosphate oxidase superfamily)
MPARQPPPSKRSRVRRLPAQASYERADIHAIVDAAHVCHVAFADEHGVHCIPTACWRGGDALYIHGSRGSRMLGALLKGPACVTITHLDGLVLARSAFNHTMNYRSAVIHGTFELVAQEDKAQVLDLLVDHIAPGRRGAIRGANAKELKATDVLRLSLAEASAKIRRGGPKDDDADLALEVWAGELPFVQGRRPALAAEGCMPGMPGEPLWWMPA